MSDNDLYWNQPEQTTPMQKRQYEADYNLLQSQPLDFQPFREVQPNYNQYYSPYSNDGLNPYADSTVNSPYPDLMMGTTQPMEQTEFEETEPPLLEELEIYPERILDKMLLALFPFRDSKLSVDSEFVTKGTDLAGPVSFCIILAINLFISGSKIYFGYIYGLSVMSCIMMYCLLSLMTSTNVFTFANVTSILGYSLLPIVGLSALGVFMSLHDVKGIVISTIAVIWSSLSAARLFIAVSGDDDQKPLIAYPCLLVCGVFALLVVF